MGKDGPNFVSGWLFSRGFLFFATQDIMPLLPEGISANFADASMAFCLTWLAQPEDDTDLNCDS